MRPSPLIRVHPVGSKTPMRLIVSAIGRIFTPKGGGVRVVEMRPTRQGPQGPAQMSIEVTETMKDLEALWPGFVRLRTPANDGGLEFLINVQHAVEYSVGETVDAETKAKSGEAVALHLEGRALPILIGEPWGVADQKIMEGRRRIEDYLLGRTDLPADPLDAGLVA